MSADMPKMPEPVAFYETEGDEWHIYPRGTSTYEHIRDHQKARIGVHVFALYTAAQLQEAARQAMERECEWTRDSDFESEVWNTACGNAFIFTDGGPAENDAKFCCYCGGKLRALIPQSEERHG